MYSDRFCSGLISMLVIGVYMCCLLWLVCVLLVWL